MIELNSISFLRRLTFVLKKIHFTAYIYIILISIVLILLSLIVSILFVSIFFLIPVFIESYVYLYKIELNNDCIMFYYLKFNKRKCMKSDGKNLRIIRHDTIPLGSKTGRSFTIIKDFGKGKKVKILKQYEINDWAQEENVQKLMALINTDSW